MARGGRGGRGGRCGRGGSGGRGGRGGRGEPASGSSRGVAGRDPHAGQYDASSAAAPDRRAPLLDSQIDEPQKKSGAPLSRHASGLYWYLCVATNRGTDPRALQ